MQRIAIPMGFGSSRIGFRLAENFYIVSFRPYSRCHSLHKGYGDSTVCMDGPGHADLVHEDWYNIITIIHKEAAINSSIIIHFSIPTHPRLLHSAFSFFTFKTRLLPSEAK